MRRHHDFILTPIEVILEDAAMALGGMKDGIEAYPLYEYLMQSVFLKMTGFQEQKMKCICWELATDDYRYRYNRFKKDPLGECSSLSEKNKVLADLVIAIRKTDADFRDIADEEKDSIIIEVKDVISEFFYNSSICKLVQHPFIEYEELVSGWRRECVGFGGGKCLSDCLGHCENCSNNKTASDNTLCRVAKLSDAYRYLFDNRNRLAHNTSSYQGNLPSLQTMRDAHYVLNNYFLHFALLLMIDKIFISLFRLYIEKNNDNFTL